MRIFKTAFIAGLGFAGGLCAFGLVVLAAQSLNSFAPNEVVSAASMNANFAQIDGRLTTLDTDAKIRDTRMAPVGTILAWHKNLTGVPGLPAGWLECNGQMVADPDSALNGTNLPDLNGQRRFLRGNGTSGALEASANLQHTHASNIIVRDGHATFTYFISSAGQNPLGSVYGSVEGHANAWPAHNPNVTFSGGSESRPVNMSVVWIIRIK